MPWTKTDYPDSMKNLPKPVRDKAIDIANALLDDTGMPEGIIIATAISRAKDWAANRGLKTESKSTSRSRKTDVKKHGEDRYVIPHGEGGWAVKKEGAKRAEKVFRSKKDAIRRGAEEAREANAGLTVQKRTGKVERRVSFNPRRRAKKTSR